MITYLLPGERGKFELSGKLALGIYFRDSPEFTEHSVGYRAHRAVTFAIAWLSCLNFNIWFATKSSMPPAKAHHSATCIYIGQTASMQATVFWLLILTGYEM